jgi:hypothetical protein
MDDTITRYQGGTPPGADQKPVNQALQGGGSHGAFAWGVLDKLLEDGRLTIDAMSATSAGCHERRRHRLWAIDRWGERRRREA